MTTEKNTASAVAEAADAQSSISKNDSPKVKSSREKNRELTYDLAMLGLLTAITLLMGFTPIGYVPIGVLKVTFMTIPVIVAAALMKPQYAAVIGGMFGITSFIQAMTGMSLLTGALFQLNPVLTFLLCVVPRVLEGLLGGLIFQALNKIDKTKFISYVVTSLSVPVLNTLLFMTALYAEIKIIVAGNANAGAGLADNLAVTFSGVANASAGGIFAFFAALVGLQALVEAGVCFVLGTAITKALSVAVKKIRK